MELKQLEYFQTIYEEGSISKAAEKLFISQQGVSKAVASLEKELDCKLFERTRGGVTATPAGEVFQKGAAKLLEEKNSLLREMRQYRQSECLSVCMVIGSRFSLPHRFYDRFLQRHPGLTLDIKELENEECIEALESGKTDVALIHNWKDREGYKTRLFKKEVLSVVLPTDHPLASRTELQIKDLDGLTMVWHQGSSSKWILQKCREHGVVFEREIQVPGVLALYQTCANMRVPGLSLESINGKFRFDNLVSIPINKEEANWEVELVYQEKMEQKALIKDFLDFLCGLMREKEE